MIPRKQQKGGEASGQVRKIGSTKNTPLKPRTHKEHTGFPPESAQEDQKHLKISVSKNQKAQSVKETVIGWMLESCKSEQTKSEIQIDAKQLLCI